MLKLEKNFRILILVEEVEKAASKCQACVEGSSSDKEDCTSDKNYPRVINEAKNPKTME